MKVSLLLPGVGRRCLHKIDLPLGEGDSCSGPNSVPGSGAPSPIPGSISDIIIDEIKEEKRFVFKDPAFQHSSKSTNKKRAWRSLKQIVAQERVLPWPEDAVHYSSIDALPSFKPVKKYSDISGLLSSNLITLYTSMFDHVSADPAILQLMLDSMTHEERSSVLERTSDLAGGTLN
uniref:Uncharacterized protein n=1 Tax=Timema tahoe TaxID=61484 RepID=A0A7R9IEM3_9NEOP|nr:unnamed protein product [Timema tahoe]